MNKIDLHLHSTFSDGIFDPFELMKLAKDKGIRILSITDHDTIKAIDSSLKISHKLGLDFIPGIEISSQLNSTEIHLLAYYFDYKNKAILKLLEDIKLLRTIRAKEIVAKLNKIGFLINFSDVEKFSGSSPVCRPHIAEALIKKGYVKNYAEAFRKYLYDSGPADVKKSFISPSDVIKLIHKANGIVFIAHPLLLNDALIDKLISFGVDGIEVIHPMHREKDIKKYKRLAEENGLLQSGGSDFHGRDKRDYQNLGKYTIDESNFNRMKKYYEGRFRSFNFTV